MPLIDFLVKIILLAEIIGVITAATAWLWFKWLGIDFKKWMDRHERKRICKKDNET